MQFVLLDSKHYGRGERFSSLYVHTHRWVSSFRAGIGTVQYALKSQGIDDVFAE
jgi:hypothetical protein